MSLSLVQFQDPGRSTVRSGFYDGSLVRSLDDIVGGLDVMGLLGDWSRWSAVLRDVRVTDLEIVANADILSPLIFPRKVLCAGANYYDHAAEMGVAPPDPHEDPFFFLKTPTTTVVGPFADIRISPDPAAQFDWEAELGVVIGTLARDVPVESALTVVAGYLVANDISARGPFRRRAAPPFDWDWLAQKNQDDSCPIGPGLTPAWLIDDPQDLSITLQVNGETKQKSNTSQMVVDIAHLIAGASRTTTLEPGDVLLTGTPAGVGLPRNTFLRPGDVVTVEIENLGRISNHIVTRASSVTPTNHQEG